METELHAFLGYALQSWVLIFLIFVVPSIMFYSNEISPTRCNNCVFILRKNLTKTYNLSEPAYLWPYTAYVLLMMGEIVARNM